METNNHPLLVLAIISFSFAASTAAPHHRPGGMVSVPPVVDANVKSVCDKATDPAVCVATVSPLLLGKTDPASVLVACIKRCMNENKLAMKKIPMCQGTYQSSNDYLKEALDGFKTKALADIQSKIGTARVDITTCLDDLQASSDGDTSATQIAKSLENMVLACEDLSFKAKIF